MKSLQSPQNLLLVALFIIRGVTANNIPNRGWPSPSKQCSGFCFDILAKFGNLNSISIGCSSFLHETITPAQVTSTLAVTLSAGGGLTPRQDSEPGQGNPEDGNGHQNLARGLAGIDCGGPLPPYAGGCIAPSQYSSACSCFGIVQATTTLNPQTFTVTEDITASLRSSSSGPGSTVAISTSTSASFATSTLQSPSFSTASSTSSSLQPSISSQSSLATSECSPTTITAINGVTVTISQDPSTVSVTVQQDPSTVSVTVSQGLSTVTVPQDPSTVSVTVSQALSTVSVTVPQDPSTVSVTVSQALSTVSVTVPQDPSTVSITVPQDPSTIFVTVLQDPSTVSVTVLRDPTTIFDTVTATILPNPSTLFDTVTATISQDPSTLFDTITATIFESPTSGPFSTHSFSFSNSSSSSATVASGTALTMASNSTAASSSTLFSPHSTLGINATSISNSSTGFASATGGSSPVNFTSISLSASISSNSTAFAPTATGSSSLNFTSSTLTTISNSTASAPTATSSSSLDSTSGSALTSISSNSTAFGPTATSSSSLNSTSSSALSASISSNSTALAPTATSSSSLNSTSSSALTSISSNLTAFAPTATSSSSRSFASSASMTSISSNSTGFAPTATSSSSLNFTSSSSSALSSSTCTGYNPSIPSSYEGCLLNPFSSQTFQLLDPLTGIPIVPLNNEAVLASGTNNTGSYHFSQPSNVTNGLFDLDYTDSLGNSTSVFAVFGTGDVGFESTSSDGNSFENNKFITTIFSVQCDGVISAGILCGPQFQFTYSTSGSTATEIAPQNNATIGIPFFGLASNVTANDARCQGTTVAVPNPTPSNTTSPAVCASVLGLDPPYSNFQNCCGVIDQCYDGTTASGIHDCSTTFNTCNTAFFQCAQNSCQNLASGNSTNVTGGNSTVTQQGCQNLANDYKNVLDSFVGREAFKVASAESCSCK